MRDTRHASGSPGPRTPPDDRVLPATRALSVTIVPFLVVAFVVLYLWPGDTDRWFAWGIAPTLTPMILGSVYIGGAYFFVNAARASRWHAIKVGFIPVTLFASLLGVATILHWEKFNHDHVAFWLWAGLYFTTPVLVLSVWAANRNRDRPADRGEPVLTATAQRLAGVTGVLAVGFGAFLFVFPSQAVDIWPWALTPLTSRVLGAIFALGVAGLGIYADPRWSTARLMVQVMGLMLVLILVAAVRARDEFDTSNVLTWLFAGGFLGVLAAATSLWLRMEARAGPTEPV